MKKLIFANCILAIAVFFSFCAKPELKEELSSVNPNDVASNRETCTVTHVGVSNDATLTICGTNTNASNCVSCTGSNAQGVEIVPVIGFLNLTLTTPVEFSVRANKFTVVNLSANGGASSTGPIQIPTGGCRRFSIDANCNITAR
ncbi:MAG: hypothetical protein ACKVT2_12220 [Saprospiraceae bacterium]